MFSSFFCRRKSFKLVEARTEVNDQPFNIDVVRQLDIHNPDAIEQFHNRFINANELTLTEDFDISHGSIVDGLNRIISLQQLTNLTLQCHHFPFEKLLELLHYTPHLHTLGLRSVSICPTSSTCMQKNSLFRTLSDTNLIINLTIDNEITSKEFQYLSALFPRLESLTLQFERANWKPILLFVLSKANKNTRRLSSLCISKRTQVLIGKMRNLIESKHLLEYYTLKQISGKLYLWW